MATAFPRDKKLDVGIQSINSLTYSGLERLVTTDVFSVVDVCLNEKCPLNVAVCRSRHCRIGKTHTRARPRCGSGVDLRSIPEGYSLDAQDSSFVWKRLYEISSGDAFLTRLLSGLHFSITVHISSFFTPFCGTFIPNSIHYYQRYKKDYKENMYILYLYIRSSVHILGKKDTLDKLSPDAVDHNSFDFKADAKHISHLKEMLSVASCLSCDRCKIWGKVQLHGLIAATKIHLSMDARSLSKNEVICLVRLFHKLSKSIIETKRLESFLWRYVSVLMVYRAEAMYLLLGIIVFWRFRPKM